MNNELGRKITSLTLMTIMLAGGMSFAVPGVIPAAHAANANLFVSAENSQFDNYMSGPQVIEVVVIDADINDTDQAKGEPDVTVNGNTLRMVQAVDGNWYGYFADKTQAQRADATTINSAGGIGLDFGQFCGKDSTSLSDDGTALFSETVGVAVPIRASSGYGVNGTDPIPTCTATITTQTNGTAGVAMNVVREAKEPNTTLSGPNVGQIHLKSASTWPLIQLYDLNPTGNVVVQYNKGGGVQSTTLTFDTVEQFAGAALDRAIYGPNMQVHVTLTDLWLNIDPTDEDSWTFAANQTNANAGSYYQVFDENGLETGDLSSGGSAKLSGTTLDNLMCEDNCRLFLNTNTQNAEFPVVTLNDTADSVINTAGDPQRAESFTTDGGLLGINTVPLTFTEQGPNSGVFGTYDESDISGLKIVNSTNFERGITATLDYNDNPVSILTGYFTGSIDIQPVDDQWNSGEEIPVVVVDQDLNLNSRTDEDLDLFNPEVDHIPTLKIGSPITLGTLDTAAIQGAGASVSLKIDEKEQFSDRALLRVPSDVTTVANTNVTLTLTTTYGDLYKTIPENNTSLSAGTFNGIDLINWDLRSMVTKSGATSVSASILNGTNSTSGKVLKIATNESAQDLVQLEETNPFFDVNENVSSEAAVKVSLNFTLNGASKTIPKDTVMPIVADFFSFGFINDGITTNDRIANMLVRIEAEETGDNTGVFEGTLEYTMINQLNILDADTYKNLETISDTPTFIVMEDLTDEDAPRVNYLEIISDGLPTKRADQEEAPSHSGIVSFDKDNYKVADTVTVTLEDQDLNVDSDLVEIYTTVSGVDGSGNPTSTFSTIAANTQDVAFGDVGKAGLPTLEFGALGRLLDITFDDKPWVTPHKVGSTAATCDNSGEFNGATGLDALTFSLVETGPGTGVFTGDFEIPGTWCETSTSSPTSVTGLDMEVNYVDFRDASGEIIEVGDSAGIRANTGSVSLDRTVYPVPFGIPSDFGGKGSTSTPQDGDTKRSVFPIHQTGMNGPGISDTTSAGLTTGEFINNGDLTVHIRVNDPDFDTSGAGENTIAQNTTNTNPGGPVKISVIRGSDTVVLGYAGGPAQLDGRIHVGSDNVNSTRQFGPIVEISPTAGIFEADIPIRYTDGPASTLCPDTSVFKNLDGDGGTTELDRFDASSGSGKNYCILQGDILQVEYTDPTDASGDVNTVTDSATFDLRNGVLQSDKSVYIIGSDMILTLIEPDFDLDNDAAETYDLDLIEWDSDAATVTMGDASGEDEKFDPEPSDFRETGDSTGIFQIVVEIPKELKGDNLERGEEVILEYTDWGPSGSDYVGDEDEDVNLTIFTSNFGATVELDQKVYTWTDKVYITIVAPDHNFDSDLIDEIGNTSSDPIKISTRSADIDQYKLVETGTDTGIFTGEVILTGFTHDADGDPTTGNNGDDIISSPASGSGPTDGLLPADDDDGITVSFEFSEDETVVGSALIRWNIGEVQWLEASYPASGTGVVRVIDPDMNLDPEAVDNFDADVWSDSDAGGIDLTVTETNEATGIFEGTVFFTTTDESSGHRLRVAEGDTVTAEYQDNTLPDPYTTADELDITATSLIGTVVPPLERAPAANLRTVDAFGNSLDSVSVDQQVQISADLANGQDREQQFAYLVQIQDANGVTVSLAWITGSLSAGQSFSPALSWIPTDAGSYTATAFVWESVDNPTALSPPVSTTVNVS